jgi:hypothetical protein
MPCEIEIRTVVDPDDATALSSAINRLMTCQADKGGILRQGRDRIRLALAGGQLWQLSHPIPDFQAGPAQLIDHLQVEPEFRAGAEPMTEAQSRIGGHATPTVYDLGDAVHRDVDLPGQLSRTDTEFVELC